MTRNSPKSQTFKNCVFCGENPLQKTNEHILPQWLLKLTGNPNRVVPLMFNKAQLTFDERSFSSFVFPACKSCNDKYSKMEGKVHTTVQKILKDDFISEEELSLFLD